MSLALLTICLISQMHGSEVVGGQCKTSERSVPGKALKGHTFKEFVVRAIVDCQNTCENDPRCASYNFYISDKVCELNSQTKETRPDDFVTDELRFYMRRDGMMYSVSLRAHDCKYRESLARLKKSKILIICQKNPFGELSSKKIFSTFKNL